MLGHRARSAQAVGVQGPPGARGQALSPHSRRGQLDRDTRMLPSACSADAECRPYAKLRVRHWYRDAGRQLDRMCILFLDPWRRVEMTDQAIPRKGDQNAWHIGDPP